MYLLAMTCLLLTSAAVLLFEAYRRFRRAPATPGPLAAALGLPTVVMLCLFPTDDGGAILFPNGAFVIWALLVCWPYFLSLIVFIAVRSRLPQVPTQRGWPPTIVAMSALTVLTIPWMRLFVETR